MSGLFKSKKTTPEVAEVADPYGSVRDPLLKWLSGQIGKPAETYKGEFVAPASEQEKQSLDFLKQYTTQGTPEGINLAKEEYRKTLQGEYDPTTSPYYQAVKAESARNLEDTLGGIKSAAAGGGRYWTGARLGEEREARTDVGNALNTLLGGMAETERARRLQAAPMAAQLGQQEQQLPLQQATALQTLGALPRTLEQAQNQALYNEWLRSTQEYPLNIAQLAAGVQQPPMYGQVGYQPSIFDKYIMPAGQTAMSAAIMGMMMSSKRYKKNIKLWKTQSNYYLN